MTAPPTPYSPDCPHRWTISLTAPTAEVRRYGRKWVDQTQAAGQDIGERMEESPTHVHLRQTAAQRATMRKAVQADTTPAARRAIGRLDAPRVWG